MVFTDLVRCGRVVVWYLGRQGPSRLKRSACVVLGVLWIVVTDQVLSRGLLLPPEVAELLPY